jgi:hypothetical protein
MCSGAMQQQPPVTRCLLSLPLTRTRRRLLLPVTVSCTEMRARTGSSQVAPSAATSCKRRKQHKLNQTKAKAACSAYVFKTLTALVNAGRAPSRSTTTARLLQLLLQLLLLLLLQTPHFPLADLCLWWWFRFQFRLPFTVTVTVTVTVTCLPDVSTSTTRGPKRCARRS